MPQLELRAGNETLVLETLDTPTAAAILGILPLQATVQTWGDEIYFPASVSVSTEPSARELVKPGEIAFWADGRFIAIGFGPTPISEANEIRLAAPTNIWAVTHDDVRCLASVNAGDPVQLIRRD